MLHKFNTFANTTMCSFFPGCKEEELAFFKHLLNNLEMNKKFSTSMIFEFEFGAKHSYV